MASSPTSPTSPSGKKLVNTKSGLRMICLIDDERSAFEIDEPKWQNDNDHHICNKCGAKFSFKTRRHHCRRCGKIYCGSCCTTKVALPRLSFVDPQRVCTDCVIQAKKEIEMFERYLPILLKGAEFDLGDSDAKRCKCKLNAKTYRDLMFTDVKDANSLPHENVCLTDITSIHCMTDPLNQSSDGKPQLVGINLDYFSDSRSKSIKLNVPNESLNRSTSVHYLRTLQKAMKMIFEAAS